MKSKNFKILTLLLSVATAIALTGCGSSGTSSDNQLVGGGDTPASAVASVTVTNEPVPVVVVDDPPVVVDDPPVVVDDPPVTPPAPPPPPPTNEGKSFHISFIENATEGVDLKLYISSTIDTDANITTHIDGSSQIVHISANTVEEVTIDNSSEQKGIEISSKVVEITSKDNIVVVGLSRIPHSTDAFLALPDQILSREYYIMTYIPLTSYGFDAEFSVIAVEDNTTVEYTIPGGTKATVMLDKGETYQYQNTDDITGTHIISDKNIAVMSGTECTVIPVGHTACDHIVEEMLPVNIWEREYIAVPLATRRGGDTFRIMASEDETEIRIDDTLVATLNTGDFYETILVSASLITGNKYISVAQYSNSTSFDGVTSDPFMMLVPAINQFNNEHIIQTPDGFTGHYINIVVPTANTGDITLDGVLIDSSEFTVLSADVTFSYAQIQIDAGSHNLSSPIDFGLTSYGFASADSYGYPSSLFLTKH